MLQAIGGDEAPRSDMTTRRLAELDERVNKLELRMAELRDELAAVQCQTVPAPSSNAPSRSSSRSETCCSSPRASASCTLLLLLESVVYAGATGELELGFYPLGITGLAAEAAMIGQMGRLMAATTPRR